MHTEPSCTMTLLPIGHVSRSSPSSLRAELLILPDFVDHCTDLDELSHLLVLWWAHERVDERRSYSRVHPQRRLDLPEVGLFCTRSPVRPNPICADVVRLVDCSNGVLTVEGIQANDGTPIVDIKGWYDQVPFEPVTQPHWFQQLRRK